MIGLAVILILRVRRLKEFEYNAPWTTSAKKKVDFGVKFRSIPSKKTCTFVKSGAIMENVWGLFLLQQVFGKVSEPFSTIQK